MPLDEYFSIWSDHGLDGVERYQARAQHALMAKPSPRPAESPVNFENLEQLCASLQDCKRCPLSSHRKQIVFGSGNPSAQLLFVGEAPGDEEDQAGLPFVGKAGALLTKIIEALGYTREQVYIANAVKCRPPENRIPTAQEMAECFPFLKTQIEKVNPKIVVALGLSAARTLTRSEMTMASLRGRFQSVSWNKNLPLMATYHPAYLLRNPDAKKIVWEDMKMVKAHLESLQ